MSTYSVENVYAFRCTYVLLEYRRVAHAHTRIHVTLTCVTGYVIFRACVFLVSSVAYRFQHNIFNSIVLYIILLYNTLYT